MILSGMIFDEGEEAEFVPEEDSTSPDIDDVEGDTSAPLKKLKAELKECNKERKEYLEGWQRAKADYLNSKKRFDDERVQTVKRAQLSLIEELLPLCDSFEMALKGGEGSPEENGGAWKTGLTQIQTQLTSLLGKLDVRPIEALGELFDPYKHEALSSQPVGTEGEHDRVLQVLQKGYTQGDTLIRPAKVIIGVHTS